MMRKALFALGCFWGPDDYFAKVPGVLQTTVGYSGGEKENPTYEEVCEGSTGHAEVVEITYDPDKVSYDELLRRFWNQHDPTLPHKTQYASVIFYTDEEQRAEAEKAKAAEQMKRKDPLLTEIRPAGTFWRAEEYHQKYYQKNNVSNVC